MDPRQHVKISTYATNAFFGPTPIFLDPRYTRHPRYLADSPHMFVALQLPLYYLEQLHQLAIEN